MLLKPYRRALLAIAASAVAVALIPVPAFAQAKMKVAAIYTVPVEQQWGQPNSQGTERCRAAR